MTEPRQPVQNRVAEAGDAPAGGPAGGPVVWCDFGGVLTSPVANALGRVVAAAGVPAAVLLAAMEDVAAAHGLTGLGPLELGLLSERDWGDQMAAALAPEWTPAVDLGRMGEHWYAAHRAENALLARLVELSERGVRLGLLTNSIREWEPHREALLPGVSQVFESTINSFEAGVRKPDAAIYELAERALGRAGADCLLIDDTEENCVVAAGRGWSAIHHVSADATIAQLDAWLTGRLDRP
ncbi:HAD-IA family hydrolase [Pseudofrankia asymbiotica]|uniref:HAD-IA family hydrolase n=1 Tax=Pseudofrankia asymbiotica TaxID=1834516 RepID=UPI001F5195BD|nr:HAD-IA family hydrolase [Pseudofrankia asymbiotica]